MLFYFCQRLGKEILVEDWKVTINRGLGSVSYVGMYVCMYVCMHVCMYVYIRVYVHIYICIYMYIYVCMYIYK